MTTHLTQKIIELNRNIRGEIAVEIQEKLQINPKGLTSKVRLDDVLVLIKGINAKGFFQEDLIENTDSLIRQHLIELLEAEVEKWKGMKKWNPKNEIEGREHLGFNSALNLLITEKEQTIKELKNI